MVISKTVYIIGPDYNIYAKALESIPSSIYSSICKLLMYCISGGPGSSLLIESTDSVVFKCIIYNIFFSFITQRLHSLLMTVG